MKVLVTGSVRSGTSRDAEPLPSQAPPVTYVAPGPRVDEDSDPGWVARIAAHRARRPARWTTVESGDLASASRLDGAVLVDRVAPLLDHRGDVVLVTNEVGLGVIPAHRSGRLFRDLLGMLDQRVATACDEVHLVVSGRVLKL